MRVNTMETLRQTKIQTSNDEYLDADHREEPLQAGKRYG